MSVADIRSFQADGTEIGVGFESLAKSERPATSPSADSPALAWERPPAVCRPVAGHGRETSHLTAAATDRSRFDTSAYMSARSGDVPTMRRWRAPSSLVSRWSTTLPRHRSERGDSVRAGQWGLASKVRPGGICLVTVQRRSSHLVAQAEVYAHEANELLDLIGVAAGSSAIVGISYAPVLHDQG